MRSDLCQDAIHTSNSSKLHHTASLDTRPQPSWDSTATNRYDCNSLIDFQAYRTREKHVIHSKVQYALYALSLNLAPRMASWLVVSYSPPVGTRSSEQTRLAIRTQTCQDIVAQAQNPLALKSQAVFISETGSLKILKRLANADPP